MKIGYEYTIFIRHWTQNEIQMGEDHAIHVLSHKSKLARLAFTTTVFDNVTRIGIIISILRESKDFKSFITSIRVMKEDYHLWRQVSSLRVK